MERLGTEELWPRAALLVQKMNGPWISAGPIYPAIIRPTTCIVHAIDASGKYGPSYTTNDIT